MRYKERKVRLYFRGDAAFASPEIYEYLEAEGLLYVIRSQSERDSPAEHCPSAYATCRSPARPCSPFPRQLQLSRPDRGTRSAVSWPKWSGTPAELVPRVGLDRFHRSSVTNLSRPTKRVVAFYNHRGTAEQHIKEGKNAINWTRLSCRKFRNNAVRLQLHALAYNLGNFMRTLALPKEVGALVDDDVARQAGEDRGQGSPTWPLRFRSNWLRWRCRGDLFRKILSLIDDLRRRPAPA